MKKIFIALGLMLGTLTLTGCSNDLNSNAEPQRAADLSIIVDSDVTRTTASGNATSWAADDGMNVFHAAVGGTTYTSDGKFTIAAADLAANCFRGTSSADWGSTAYDWYFFYPYVSYITTPANTSAGYTTVGAKTQTQSAVNNRAHIAGADVPLYGKATSVEGGKPFVTMHHVTTLLAFNITNPDAANSITVKSIKFSTSSQNITGQYYVNFSAEAPSFTDRSASYVYKEVDLTVANGTIGASETGSFYVAVKPFTAPAGEVLTTIVTLSDGNVCTKSVTLSSAKNFVSGRMNDLNISYAADPLVTSGYSKVSALSGITEGTYVVLCGDYFLTSTNSTSSSIHPNGGTAQTCSSVGMSVVDDVLYGTVPDAANWTFKCIDNSSVAILNANGKYLFNTSDNNGVFIGATQDWWTFATYSYNSVDGFSAIDALCNRYVGMYNLKDWRSYTGLSTYESGTNNGVLRLYKKDDTRTAVSSPVLSVANNVVSWSAVANAESYDIYVDNVYQTTVSEPTYTVTKAQQSDDVTYNVKVVAQPNASSATYTHSAAASVSVTVAGTGAPKVYYTKVTTAPADWSGKYLITYTTETTSSAEAKIFSGQSGTNNYGGFIEHSFDKTVGIESTTTTDACQVIVAKTDDGYTITIGEKYLYYTGSSNNLYFTTTQPTDKTDDWTFSIDTGYDVSITNASNNKRRIRWNDGSPRFSCYTSALSAITMYKLTE